MAADIKDQRAIIFIAREGLQYFGSLSKNIISHPFDKKVVRDLDITDVGSYIPEITSFIDQNKLSPSPVLFIFSESACFFQDIKEAELIKLKEITEEFVNTVPFDTILTRVYKARDGSRIISINERLYRETAGVFEAKGFLSLGVMPAFALGGRMATMGALDPATARQLLTNIEMLRQQSFLVSDIKNENETEEERTATGSKPVIEKSFKITPGLIVLAIVFVVLIVVFIVLLTRQ